MSQAELDADPNIKYVIGIDECGTGSAWSAASVGVAVLPTNSDLVVKDSKAYSSEKLLNLAYTRVRTTVLYGRVELIHVSAINKYGLSPAKDYVTFKILEEVVEKYHQDDSIVIMDGAYIPKRLPDFLKGYRILAIPKADVTIKAVSSAAVLAKVEKDAFLMDVLSRNPEYKVYGIEENKGYLTPSHISALKIHGPSPLHRLNVKIIKDLVDNGK